MSEYERLKAQKDDIVGRERRSIEAPLRARIAELEEVVQWISAQQNLFFAECTQAEKIVSRCKQVMRTKPLPAPPTGRTEEK